MKSHIAFILFLAVGLSSCSIEKRIYQPGYFISGRSSSPKEVKIHKKIQPEIFSESVKTIADADSSQVKSIEETLVVNLIEKLPIIKPSSKIDILVQETPDLLKINTDSLPDEIKLLTQQSAKTQKIAYAFLISASIPLTISFLGLFTAFLLFVPYAFGLIYIAEEKIPKFFLTCLILVLLSIPFLIVSLILNTIAKKQRRKLRKMGAMNK